MKYRTNERLDIGRRIYDGEFTCAQAMERFDISKNSAKRYLQSYRAVNDLPTKREKESMTRAAFCKPTTKSAEDLADYEAMTREELLLELVQSKINEARAKKGYEVKGEGAAKEYIPLDKKNIK